MNLLILLGIVSIVSDRGIATRTRNIGRTNKGNTEIAGHVNDCFRVAEMSFNDLGSLDHTNIPSTKETEDLAKDLGQCVFAKTGVIDSDGTFNTNAAITLMTSFEIEEDEAADLLKSCTTARKWSGKPSAWEIFNCAKDLRRTKKEKEKKAGQVKGHVNECHQLAEMSFYDLGSLGHTNIPATKGMEDLAKDFSLCVFDKSGVIEPDGKFNADAAMTLMSAFKIDDDEAADLLKNCMAVRRRNEKPTAWEIFNCARDLRRENKEKEEIAEHVDDCLQIAEMYFDDLGSLGHTNVPATKEMIDLAKDVSKCVFERTGVIDPAGKFNTDAALALMTSFEIEKDEAADLLKKCMAVGKNKLKPTAWEIFNCVGKADPFIGVWFWRFV